MVYIGKRYALMIMVLLGCGTTIMANSDLKPVSHSPGEIAAVKLAIKNSSPLSLVVKYYVNSERKEHEIRLRAGDHTELGKVADIRNVNIKTLIGLLDKDLDHYLADIKKAHRKRPFSQATIVITDKSLTTHVEYDYEKQ